MTWRALSASPYLTDRCERLFLLRGKKVEQLDKKHLAKAAK